MWLIPGKTKVQLEIFKGVGVIDILLGLVAALIVVLMVSSNIPNRFIFAGVILTIAVLLLARVDEEPNYQVLLHMLNHAAVAKHYSKDGVGAKDMHDLSAFTGIADGHILYDTDYMGAVLEVSPVNFRLFSQQRKNSTIVNGFGAVLRTINNEYGVNIVKVDRPVHYEEYVEKEKKKLEDLRAAYENAQMSEAEFKTRSEVVYERIQELSKLDEDNDVVIPFYYLVFFDSDARQLENIVSGALTTFGSYDIEARRLDDREIAIFLKYTNNFSVNEEEVDDILPEEYAHWAMPDTVDFKVRTTEINHVTTHLMRVIDYPASADNAWLASVMTLPGTKVVVKCCPMDMTKAVSNIDHSLFELQTQLNETGVQSKIIDLQSHIDSLSNLLVTLRGENEILLNTNVYVAAYDIVTSEKLKKIEEGTKTILPRVTNMKKSVRRVYSEQNMKARGVDFQQFQMYVGSQVSGYDPFSKSGRSIPSNSVAASYPWIFATIKDKNGTKLGSSEGVPVFMDFFRRDSERVNSNMVIVGKSGSGKSYATKGILTNLAADNAKIFILDPENEYSELAENLHGKFINVANAQYGRLNPFQIITALDDESGDSSVSGSYSAHLQFLEEFFRQILPECDHDSLEYLNLIIERMYLEKGINAETNLLYLKPEDYPIFDDLYDAILKEFQQTENEYIRTMLRTLVNYISKFAAGGRNSNIWNGPSSVTTEENFTVFNFQSLLSNRNAAIANAQMLLVLKYIDNEIIKNRDYNTRYHANRKIVVVIDEAHVFIDTKFPVALDFMFQLAKRIRKYNGMQIVITQNIKDFVGSPEIARKSSAIINASQYSLIFSLAPNDLEDLCTLYEKAGGINEIEQETISTAPRGQAFAVLGPMQRTTFQIEVPDEVVKMFSERGVEGRNFSGEEGQTAWTEFLGDSSEKRMETLLDRFGANEEEMEESAPVAHVHFSELTEEEALQLKEQEERAAFVSAVMQEKEAQEAKAAEEARNAEILRAAEVARAAEARRETDNSNLAQALQALASDNIEMRIQQAVAAELAKKGIKATAAASAAVPASAGLTSAAASDSEEEDDLFSISDLNSESEESRETPVQAEEEDEDDDLFGDLFSMSAFGDDEDHDTSEETESNESDEDYDDDTDWLAGLSAGLDDSSREENSSDSSDDDDFDILGLLNAGAEAMEQTSAIEQMELYDEQVIDISLEELLKYIKRRKNGVA